MLSVKRKVNEVGKPSTSIIRFNFPFSYKNPIDPNHLQ